jgi:hypothetical protein
MSINDYIRPVLELAERCTLESDIPRELREAVRYCVAKNLAWIQPVFRVAWRPAHDAARSLFGDRPVVLFPWAEDKQLEEKLLAKSRNRLLLKQEGVALLAELRLTDTGAGEHKLVPSLDALALAPGGFTLGDKPHPLTRRPLEMLGILLKSRYRSATADQLRNQLALNDESVTYPEQVIRDTACKLRKALRKAANAAGLKCPTNPLPSTGRGRDLSYSLAFGQPRNLPR